MARHEKLAPATVEPFLAAHAGWERVGDGAIAKTFHFADWNGAMGFAVRVGLWAERKDHHPDLELAWGRARVLWSTHDAGGVTALDLEAAEATDRMASDTGGRPAAKP
jgi:4a-hydroxytetrahydrobiopterin dehydratase